MMFTMKFAVLKITLRATSCGPKMHGTVRSAGSGGVSPLAQPYYTAIDTETALKLTTIKSDAHDVCHLPYLNSNS